MITTKVIPFLLFFTLTLFAALTNPTTGGPFILIAFLILVFLTSFSIFYTTLGYAKKRALFTSSRTAIYYTSIIVASGVVFLVGLQSLRQLQYVDLILVSCFQVLTLFYVHRRF